MVYSPTIRRSIRLRRGYTTMEKTSTVEKPQGIMRGLVPCAWKRNRFSFDKCGRWDSSAEREKTYLRPVSSIGRYIAGRCVLYCAYRSIWS